MSFAHAVVYFLVSLKGYSLGHIHEHKTRKKKLKPDRLMCSLKLDDSPERIL